MFAVVAANAGWQYVLSKSTAATATNMGGARQHGALKLESRTGSWSDGIFESRVEVGEVITANQRQRPECSTRVVPLGSLQGPAQYSIA